MMDGGAGIDTLSYQHSSAGVWASLDTGVAANGDAQGDTFANFENLVGSGLRRHSGRQFRDRRISGGAGNDPLVGDGFFPNAMSSDTFVFDAVGFGKDIVGDLRRGQDHLQIDHTIFASFAVVQSHMTQAGADTVITFDANNSITLSNVQMESARGRFPVRVTALANGQRMLPVRADHEEGGERRSRRFPLQWNRSFTPKRTT